MRILIASFGVRGDIQPYLALAAEVELLAAGLLAASSAFLDLAAVVNWALGVQDEFKARSPGLIAGSVSALLSVPGLAILIWGVFQGL